MKRNYHQALKGYRQMGNQLEEVNDRRGNTVYLNFTKHLLRGKRFKNEDYQREFIRYMKNKQSQVKEIENDK